MQTCDIRGSCAFEKPKIQEEMNVSPLRGQGRGKEVIVLFCSNNALEAVERHGNAKQRKSIPSATMEDLEVFRPYFCLLAMHGIWGVSELHRSFNTVLELLVLHSRLKIFCFSL